MIKWGSIFSRLPKSIKDGISMLLDDVPDSFPFCAAPSEIFSLPINEFTRLFWRSRRSIIKLWESSSQSGLTFSLAILIPLYYSWLIPWIIRIFHSLINQDPTFVKARIKIYLCSTCQTRSKRGRNTKSALVFSNWPFPPSCVMAFTTKEVNSPARSDQSTCTNWFLRYHLTKQNAILYWSFIGIE